MIFIRPLAQTEPVDINGKMKLALVSKNHVVDDIWIAV